MNAAALILLEGQFDASNLKQVLSGKFERAFWVSLDESGDDLNLLKDPRIEKIQLLKTDDLFGQFIDALKSPHRRGLLGGFEVIKGKILAENIPFYERSEKILASAIQTVKQTAGFREDSLLGLKNTLMNKEFIEKNPGINCLFQKFKDRPAIILSTGPSLIKSIELLRDLQDKAVFIAADASLKILLENEIVPHFVLTIERGIENKKFFENLRVSSLNSEIRQTHFVTYPLTEKEVIESYKGCRWVCFRNYAFHELLEQQCAKGVLPTSASVAHMATSFADFLGSSPIVLVGQDLAFDPDNFASHSKGVAFTDWEKGEDEAALRKKLAEGGLEFFWVAGNLRERVPTSSLYLYYMQEFSYMAPRVLGKLFNATDGGAKIPGIPWRSLNDLQSEWESKPDAFPMISNLRENAGLDGKLSFEVFAQFLERKVAELSSSLEMVRAVQSGPEVLQEEIQSLTRKAQMNWMQDFAFEALIVQMAGRLFVDAEVAWTKALFSGATVSEKLKLQEQWLSSLNSVAVEALGLLRQF